MSPVTHFLSGWVLANVTPFDRRDRAIVALACVVPDVDGLGAIPDVLTKNSAHPLTWFSDYHHLLHNAAFAMVVAVAAFALERFRSRYTLRQVLILCCWCWRLCDRADGTSFF